MARKDGTDYSEYHAALGQLGVENEFIVAVNSIEILSFRLHPHKIWRFFMTRRIQQTLIPKGFVGEVCVNPDQTITLEPYLRTAQEVHAWKVFSESANVEKLLEEIINRVQQTTAHFFKYVLSPIAHAAERLVYESELASGVATVKENGDTLRSTEDLLRWFDEMQRYERQAIRDRIPLPGAGPAETVTKQRLIDAISRRHSKGASVSIKELALDLNSQYDTVRKALDRHKIQLEGQE